MSDLLKNLKTEFQDAEYRYAYAESFLNTKLAAQIKALREQRGQTQVEVAEAIGIKQPGYRRFEDVNHSVWKTDSLWSIAKAHGVRLCISFESFGSIIDEKRNFKKEALWRPSFEDDPIFKNIDKSLIASIAADGALIVPIDSHMNYRGSRPEGVQNTIPKSFRVQPTGAISSGSSSTASGWFNAGSPEQTSGNQEEDDKKIKIRISRTQTRYSPHTHRKTSNG